MNKQLIDIQDLDLLKITKVKDWSINFDYDGIHYLLHGTDEPGEFSYQDLYIRTLDEHGKYDLKLINSKVHEREYVSRDYIKNQKGRSIVYKNVDKKFFAYKLTRRGFATGIMEQEVKDKQAFIDDIHNQIKEHEKLIRFLRDSIRGLE